MRFVLGGGNGDPRRYRVRREGGVAGVPAPDAARWLIQEEDAGEIPVDARQVEPGRWSLLLDGRSHDAHVRRVGESWLVDLSGRTYSFDLEDPDRAALGRAAGAAAGLGEVNAPMPGRVVRILAAVGDTVEQDQGVIVVEAMKMENELTAPRAGVITAVHVKEGDTVEGGAALMAIGDA